MCGIVGIVSSNDVNQQIYDSLLLLQHRGQDSTGIATMENTVFHIHKVKGQVNTAYRTRDMRNLIGKIGLGHVRYATKGSAESVEEAQPFYVNAPYGIVLIHNGNLTNTRDLEKQLFNVDKRHTNSSSDTEMVLNVFATELQEQIHNQQLEPDEYSTGTFTLSNLGMFGVDKFDAILPPGTGAILAIASSKPTVVANSDGSISVKKIMQVNLTADHRVIYGADGASFLKDLANLIENEPETLVS